MPVMSGTGALRSLYSLWWHSHTIHTAALAIFGLLNLKKLGTGMYQRSKKNPGVSIVNFVKPEKF